MSDNPTPEFDDRLWVELVDSDGRWLLSGNPHTFPGRFDVWNPERGDALTVSKSDVVDASEPARWWIEGFLSGNEPSLDDYLGTDAHSAGVDDSDHPAFQRWREALDHFRRSGDTLLLQFRPTRPMAVERVNGHIPWMLAGGEVWQWQEGEWRGAQDQPSLTHFPTLTPLALPGTACVDQNHDMEDVGDTHVVCVNCGLTMEADPA